MARFSLGGDEDDGEGPSSSPRRKRARILLRERRAEREQPQRTAEEEEEVDVDEGAEGEEEQESEDELDEEAEGEQEQESEDEESEEEEEEEQQEQEQDDDFIGNGLIESPLLASAILFERPNHQVGYSSATRTTSNAAGNQQEGPPRSISPVRDGSVVITLTDPEVLDCLICYEPLSSPVFQCENGHIACSSCCTNIKNKCPSCSWPIGYNRCRAIEKVLESIKMSCQNIIYGCTEFVTYNKRSEHEKACTYSPCSCPHSGCNFISSTKQLYQHFSSNHVNSATRLQYNCTFPIAIKRNDKFLVLQEEKGGTLFILHNHVEILGNVVMLSCIQPSFMKGFFYELVAKTNGSSLRLQSYTKSTPTQVSRCPSTDFLLIPRDVLCSFGQLKMDLCIWRFGQYPTDFHLSCVT